MRWSVLPCRGENWMPAANVSFWWICPINQNPSPVRGEQKGFHWDADEDDENRFPACSRALSAAMSASASITASRARDAAVSGVPLDMRFMDIICRIVIPVIGSSGFVIVCLWWKCCVVKWALPR